MKEISVIKRDGRQEPLDIEKIHKCVFWACENLTNVSPSDIEMRSSIQFCNKMKTEDIHEVMVKASADLIAEDQPNYTYVAARLRLFDLRKKIFGQFHPIPLKEIVQNNTKRKLYDPNIIKSFDDNEWEKLDKILKHKRDFHFTYAGIEQMIGKYLAQNRVKNIVYETPQVMYMMIAITLFKDYPKDNRIKHIKEAYDCFSKFEISLATPILAGLRTPQKQFSSCFPAGQSVFTSTGLKNIEDIEIGEKILTKTGEYHNVISTTNKLFKGKHTISFRNSFGIPWDFESTEEHLIWGLPKKDKSHRKKYSVEQWMRADEVTVGDYVQIPFNKHVTQQKEINLFEFCDWNESSKYIIQENKLYKPTHDKLERSGKTDNKVSPTNNIIPISKDFMRFLGYFLAEGHVEKNNNSLTFTLHQDEERNINDICNIGKNIFGINATKHISKNDKSIRITFYSLPMKLLILKLCKTFFDKKIIHDLIMRTDPELQKELLIGVIRGDGCITACGARLTMSNRTLIHQLGLICLRCGLFPSLNKKSIEQLNKNRPKNGIFVKNPTFFLHLGITGNYEFLLEIDKNKDKLNVPGEKSKYPKYSKYFNGKYFSKILEIKKYDSNNEIVYDIGVDNVHSFTVSGIAVHNCVVIETDDSLDSLISTSGAIVKYVASKAGIGIGAGRIRALGSSIRAGDAYHTGITPFYKYFESSVKSVNQGGVRNASATLHTMIWHYEIEDILVLKNNKGTEDNRVRKLDYSIQISRLFYQRLLNNEDITLFSPHEVKDLYDAFFVDQEKFRELYLHYEQKSGIMKKKISAKKLFALLAMERAETGRVYVMNVDHANDHSSFLDPIRMSNLCVAPETKILTDKGYKIISTLENKNVNIWNGEEFSNVIVKKTGINQKLITIKTDTGQDLTCTPYHKFYIQPTYNSSPKEVKASELKAGDKLVKFKLPDISKTKLSTANNSIEYINVLSRPYANGFYSGDGSTIKNKHKIYLYDKKRTNEIKSRINSNKNWTIEDKYNRDYCYINNLKRKFFVPLGDYSVEDKLEWLAGYLDADGTICKNDKNESLQIKSINRKFLKEIQLMLHEIGIHSKVKYCKPEGYQKFPANDKTGKNKEYYCKEAYRLLISSSALYDLSILYKYEDVAFPCRLKWKIRQPNRNAEKFIKITSVIDENRTDDTYCFNEPRRHRGIFNGILTGQCQEISLPTEPMENVLDPEGEIGLCTLCAVNLGIIKSLNDFERINEVAVRLLDSILSYQDYPVPSAEKATKRRSLGIGFTNLAYFLAKNDVKYSDGSALRLVDEIAEAHQYWLIKASCKLAREFGPCEYFNRTKYSKGILPIDTYSKHVDLLTKNRPYNYDWEALRQEILENGMRHSTLSAQMPCESSSLVINSTNGIEPPRSFITIKQMKHGVLKQVVPDYIHLKNKYEPLWEMGSNEGYHNLIAIIQKYFDQSISCNFNYDPSKYEDGKIPTSVVLKDMLYAYKMGIKNFYYHQTRDLRDETIEDNSGCAGGACAI